ncbi:MAG: dihydrolipoamide acetyltransferase family protein [Chloroflexota bacterium]
MAKEVVMPALGMSQDTGTLIQWFKAPGDTVTKGEPLMEIETDKATVEIEAPASGVLSNVTAQQGDVVPVGQTIALIVAIGEATAKEPATLAPLNVTPVARRVAAEHNLDLMQVKPQGGRIQKEDVLAYLTAQSKGASNGRILASPKARRLAQEQGLELTALRGSGPDGAVLSADVVVIAAVSARQSVADPAKTSDTVVSAPETLEVSRLWRVMVDRISQAWTTIPHFYLLREVNATQLMAWLADTRTRASEKITYTDLLVKSTAAALRQHPRLNASWQNNSIVLNRDINIGLAVAVEDGLVVPVIRQADAAGLSQLAAQRIALVAKAQANKLLPPDISDGTFTISNLGMYGVDAFNAIVNPPQAAILAISRIADRVVPLNGQPAVQPIINLSLSCDHRVVDGARGAQFLQTLADLLENPMRLLD